MYPFLLFPGLGPDIYIYNLVRTTFTYIHLLAIGCNWAFGTSSASSASSYLGDSMTGGMDIGPY